MIIKQTDFPKVSGTVPYSIVLHDEGTEPHKFVVHYVNRENGGRFWGSYHDCLKKAELTYYKKVEKELKRTIDLGLGLRIEIIK